MSERKTVARPYASAAYSFAKETSQVADWDSQLALLAQVVGQDEVRDKIYNPKISPLQRAEIIIGSCGDGLLLGVSNLLRLLASRKRLPLLPEIYVIFQSMREDDEGRIQAEITLSSEADEVQLDALRQSLSRRFARSVEINVKQDPSLIGGAIISAGDVVIDGSMRGQLQALASALRM